MILMVYDRCQIKFRVPPKASSEVANGPLLSAARSLAPCRISLAWIIKWEECVVSADQLAHLIWPWWRWRAERDAVAPISLSQMATRLLVLLHNLSLTCQTVFTFRWGFFFQLEWQLRKSLWCQYTKILNWQDSKSKCSAQARMFFLAVWNCCFFGFFFNESWVTKGVYSANQPHLCISVFF